MYYDIDEVQKIICSQMSAIIEEQEEAGADKNETTFVKAQTIVAAYTILEYYSDPRKFKEYCEERRKHREANNGC
jgi:hypothetical protein